MTVRAAFVCADWASALAQPGPARRQTAPARFDLVLGNPPYIRTADLPTLMPEVAHHEPASALDGGHDGLDAYRRILPALPHLLAPGGVAVLELGQGQAEAVAALARAAGLIATTRADLAGIPRALRLALPAAA